MKALVHVTLKPDVLDPQGKAIQKASVSLGHAGVSSVRQGKMFEIELDAPDEADGPPAARGALRQAPRQPGDRGPFDRPPRGVNTEHAATRSGARWCRVVSAEHAVRSCSTRWFLPWWAVWLAAPRSRWALSALAGSRRRLRGARASVYTRSGRWRRSTLGRRRGLRLRRSARRPVPTPGLSHRLDALPGVRPLRRRLDRTGIGSDRGLEPRPYLFFALMAGPLGLMCVPRAPLAAAAQSAGQLGRDRPGLNPRAILAPP